MISIPHASPSPSSSVIPCSCLLLEEWALLWPLSGVASARRAVAVFCAEPLIGLAQNVRDVAEVDRNLRRLLAQLAIDLTHLGQGPRLGQAELHRATMHPIEAALGAGAGGG